MNDETVRAREALERADDARRAGSRLARTAARAHFLHLAVFTTALVGVVGAANLWSPAGWPRAVVVGLATSGLAVVLLRVSRRSTVRVVASPRPLLVLTAVGGAIVIGATAVADLAAGATVAVAVSVVVTLVVWTAAAWWVGR